MSAAFRPNRKASDEDLIRLNSVGLSLATIGKMLDCHPTTVTLRLRELGVEPADTRRAFMEDIYTSMSPSQQAWLTDQLGPHYSIRDFIKNTLAERFVASRNQEPTHA